MRYFKSAFPYPLLAFGRIYRYVHTAMTLIVLVKVAPDQDDIEQQNYIFYCSKCHHSASRTIEKRVADTEDMEYMEDMEDTQEESSSTTTQIEPVLPSASMLAHMVHGLLCGRSRLSGGYQQPVEDLQ